MMVRVLEGGQIKVDRVCARALVTVLLLDLRAELLFVVYLLRHPPPQPVSLVGTPGPHGVPNPGCGRFRGLLLERRTTNKILP
jgi:hypothetical protein